MDREENLSRRLQELQQRLEEKGILRQTESTAEDLEKMLPTTPIPAKSLDELGDLRDMLQLTPSEFADTFEELRSEASLKDQMARQADLEGKTELARLIRGEATPEQLAHEALVKHAESMGGVVIDEQVGKLPDDGEGEITIKYPEGFPGFRTLTKEEMEQMGMNLAADPHRHQGVYMRPEPPSMARLESLINSLNERVQKLTEEMKFTSSANQFAHLRSGVYEQDSKIIPGLPPAPDWNTLEAYVEPLLRDIVMNIQGIPVLRERPKIAGLAPFDVLKGVDVVGEELLGIVRERGKTYGEEAILAMGEAGLVSMIVAKVMRLMWSHRGGLKFEARRDSYIDLAGYCLLTVALDEYIHQTAAKEADKPKDDTGPIA